MTRFIVFILNYIFIVSINKLLDYLLYNIYIVLVIYKNIDIT